MPYFLAFNLSWVLTILIFSTAMLGAVRLSGANDQGVTSKSRLCEKIVNHIPFYDVQYKPGTDSRGNKVKSAELDLGAPILTPIDSEFSIGIDIAQKLGLTEKGIFARKDLLSIRISGADMFVNGKKLNGDKFALVSSRCGNK